MKLKINDINNKLDLFGTNTSGNIYNVGWPFGGEDWWDPITSTATKSAFYRYAYSYPSYYITFVDGVGVLELDVPGIKKEDLDLTFEAGILHGKYKRKSVDYTFTYYADTKVGVDETSIEASLELGVLRVVMKEFSHPSKKITIK